ncbi:MAG: outer membrane protein transport protein [Myxococcota bacterium]|nr:outer membrane protein transport protein [Myxococcota bacterium]
MRTTSRRRRPWGAVVLAALAALLIGSVPAAAGGLYVNEFATTSQGNAGAGRGAWVPDASATLHNAAAMTRLGDHAFSTGFGAFLGQIEFDTESDSPSGSGNGGDQFGFVPVSSFSYVHRLSDRLRFGLSFYSLGGAKLDPSNNWGGRFEMVEISLLTISASPVVALRLTDWLSIGGGPLLSYAILNWDLRAAGPLGESTIQLDDLDDFEPAARAGVLFHPSEDFGLSVSYLSKTDFKVSGDIDLPFGVRSDIDLDLPFPQLVEVSAFWNVTDRLTLLATFNWEDWSTADDLSVTLGPLTTDAATGFKDTYKGILGANYRLGEKWLIQGGVSYDTSALRSRDRTTALPVDEQIRGALGVQHRLRPNLSVGFSFVYVNMGQGTVRGETVRGDYDRNDLFLFGVNLDFGRLWWSGRATL